MVRLQTEGVYPSAFARIQSAAIMMHGAVDPHPGRMIHASLKPHLRKLDYCEWDQCGHYPWLEKAVRDKFFRKLRVWLSGNATSTTAQSD